MVSIGELLISATYEDCRQWIEKKRTKGFTWSEIRLGCKNNEIELKEFILSKQEEDDWDISVEEWIMLVDEREKIDLAGKPAFIGDPKKKKLSAPSSKGSCWQIYKDKLINNHFTFESVDNIEKASIHVISQLSDSTEQNNPVRGIVVGNVQSGKTANMAGVIAMAADYGFNMFIILSGTIENLRKQTRTRLISDLNSDKGTFSFYSLEFPSGSSEDPNRLQDLLLDYNSNKRYITVCLKNTKRLEDLLIWLNKAKEKKAKLKVLVIDDESDQASINTANISKDLNTRISSLIKSLVFGRSKDGKDASAYQAINYIGYTATPYANFLNEANEKSLYPTNFIMTLNAASEYIGPQQIFGLPNVNDGLPIVNEVTQKELVDMSENNTMPDTLKDAVKWFLCTVACFRFYDLKKPVSMLVHTSQKIEKHISMANEIENYLNVCKLNPSIMDDLKNTYDTQVVKLSKNRFYEELPDYQLEINDYPAFDSLIPYLKELLGLGITHIQLDEEGTMKYSKALHLCIDNCQFGLGNENEVMRLVYPDKDDIDSNALSPAFIVVGGQTLSRGLTLEGLTVSYFLRTTQMADSLMQMGRWFGFRKGYELLPRLWLTKKTRNQFERLTKLDVDLREEIRNMESLNLSPKEYGPRIDLFPDFKELKITAKNRSQGIVEVETSYANKSGQTTKFNIENDVVEENYDNTIKFIKELGNPCSKEDYSKLKNDKVKNPIIWFNVDYNKVFDYLSCLVFPKQKANFGDFKEVKNWFKKEFDNNYLNNFNVLLSKVEKNKNSNKIILDNGDDVYLPTRSVIRIDEDNDKQINIKIITAPMDFYADIDLSKFDSSKVDEILKIKSYSNKRFELGAINNPLLILYIIDKESGKGEPDDGEKKLCDLNLTKHLVGYYIHIPYGNNGVLKGNGGTSKVTIKLDFEVEGDIVE